MPGDVSSDKRAAAIQQFAAQAQLEEATQTALAAIFAQQPRALVLCWEAANGVGVTSVPFSVALVHGLLQLVQEMLAEESGLEDEEEE